MILFVNNMPLVSTTEQRIGTIRRLEELRYMMEHVERAAHSLARVVSAELQSSQAVDLLTDSYEDSDEALMLPHPSAPPSTAQPEGYTGAGKLGTSICACVIVSARLI